MDNHIETFAVSVRNMIAEVRRGVGSISLRSLQIYKETCSSLFTLEEFGFPQPTNAHGLIPPATISTATTATATAPAPATTTATSTAPATAPASPINVPDDRSDSLDSSEEMFGPTPQGHGVDACVGQTQPVPFFNLKTEERDRIINEVKQLEEKKREKEKQRLEQADRRKKLRKIAKEEKKALQIKESEALKKAKEDLKAKLKTRKRTQLIDVDDDDDNDSKKRSKKSAKNPCKYICLLHLKILRFLRLQFLLHLNFDT